jgi:uncharacterized membrane protein YkvI
MLTDLSLLSWNHEQQIQFYIYFSVILVYPLSCAKNVNFLSPISFLGLICLLIGLVTIVLFGISSFGNDIFTNYKNNNSLSMWPTSFENFSTFMGVAIFSYGLCVMVFPIEESMTHKQNFLKAVLWSCVIVTVLYSLIGDVISTIYSKDPNGIHQNILVNLPHNSIYATIVRITFAMV